MNKLNIEQCGFGCVATGYEKLNRNRKRAPGSVGWDGMGLCLFMSLHDHDWVTPTSLDTFEQQ